MYDVKIKKGFLLLIYCLLRGVIIFFWLLWLCFRRCGACKHSYGEL